MSESEAAYDSQLRSDPKVCWHKFEGVKLRLADNTFYTPDFAVMNSHGLIELHELKGYWEDDARVKIKVAASLYPFVFMAFSVKRRAKRDGGGWVFTFTETF